ncbi:3-alpha-hydroxysteroid sulfotransferase-like isoform X2 [Symsagittifera roscoffensis]
MGRMFPFMEHISSFFGNSGYERAESMTTTPRLFKTHLPIHLAPQDIFTEKRKNIVVVRNPKDTAISYNTFYMKKPVLKDFYRCENLEQFLDKFLEGEILYGSWWKWTKEWITEARSHPENILVLHYEDIALDFAEAVNKMCLFLNLPILSDVKLDELRILTSIDDMKARYEPTGSYLINAGGSGGWEAHFSEGYRQKFDKLTRENFGHFPFVDKFL